MISILVCSVNKNNFDLFKKNIEETIGSTKYELIGYDNTIHNQSIFSVYNTLRKQSSYSILLYIHEDVLFVTQNWGEILIRCFEDQNVGIVGIAGSTYKSKSPSAWWDGGDNPPIINLIQHYKNGTTKQFAAQGWKDTDNSLKEVKVIDGVFIAARKDESLCFNEDLKGFHNYDLSICTDYAHHGYKIYVTKDILIEHFSTGKPDGKWIDSTHIFHNTYSGYLPLSLNNMRKESIEKINLRYFSILAFRNKKSNIGFLYWKKYCHYYPLDIQGHLRILKNYLFPNMGNPYGGNNGQ